MRIVVTGATGYVGSRLIPALLAAGHEVIAAVRDPRRLEDFEWGSAVTARHFDITEPETFETATAQADVVLYLIHSMAEGDFVERDRIAAEQMALAAQRNALQRVIYLSGHVPDVPEAELSDHVRSRLQVERVFLEAEVPALVLRAAVILGSGSTSFELIRRLTERLPARIVPTWMVHNVQPIAVSDVVLIITGSLNREARNGPVDVGGTEVLRYPELLARYAQVAGIRRREIVIPLLPVPVVGRVAAWVSGMPAGTVRALVASLKHDMVCHDDHILRELGITPIGIDEALRRALSPESEGTRKNGDPLAPAASDPEWAGGDIALRAGRRLHRVRSPWARWWYRRTSR